MIISKTPLRITLGGGGTDLPKFYEKEGGFWISGAINKFIYVVMKKRFEKPLRVAYSALEYVEHPSQLEHPIIRTALTYYGVTSNVEIASFADLPSRTGLGSSGAFTVGLLNSLFTYKNIMQNFRERPEVLAEHAYNIERNLLDRKIGKQDPYAAAFGSVRAYRVEKDGKLSAMFGFKTDTIRELERYISLFYTGQRFGSISEVLEQNTLEYLRQIKLIGGHSFQSLANEDFIGFGELVNEHWELKKKLSKGNKEQDKWIQVGKKLGAIGGKLVGAGHAGFLLFVHKPTKRESLVRGLSEKGFNYIPFSFHMEGSSVKTI